MDQPMWMAEAWQRLGTRERPGSRHNQDILDFFRDAGHADVKRDEVPWCAAFVGACLKRAGHEGTGSLLARSYLDWGQVLEYGQPGAVVILSRGQDQWTGHVGFWVGETEGSHILVGGNQSDAVTVAAFDKKQLLGIRWPAERELPTDAIEEIHSDLLSFSAALPHVLEMEGGFTDDPDDPGGPTNKGIILDVFCRHTERPLNRLTRSQRIEELRKIPDALVKEIYHSRYWLPSKAPKMPAAIAFMHFDASVNHGLTGAARLLQQAVVRQDRDIEIDGEIGPLTQAAIDTADLARLLSDYADVRRAKYRALPHLWKFGRGWLNRVQQTESRARPLLKGRPALIPPATKPTKGTDMPSIGTGSLPTKWWGSSMTIWGAALTALSTVLPIFGPALGLDVTPDVVRQAGEQLVTVIQAIGGLVGTLMTIYGRTRATQSLVRRQVQVQI